MPLTRIKPALVLGPDRICMPGPAAPGMPGWRIGEVPETFGRGRPCQTSPGRAKSAPPQAAAEGICRFRLFGLSLIGFPIRVERRRRAMALAAWLAGLLSNGLSGRGFARGHEKGYQDKQGGAGQPRRGGHQNCAG
jgi:hypothetical protein